MKHTLLLGLVLSAFAVPVCAQSVPVEPVSRDRLPPPGYKDSVPNLGHYDNRITDEQTAALLCQATQLMDSTDNAEYKPGVDVQGRAVAPADASTQAFQIPDRVDIPVNIDILKSVGAITSPTPDLATNVGTVSVMKGGQVQFNGRDLTNNVSAFCAGNAIPKTPPPFLPTQAQPQATKPVTTTTTTPDTK